MTSAVIFDVDGVLLELTREEEDAFFVPFARWLETSSLPRDWASYRIRNDDEIVNEITALNGIPESEKPAIVTAYLTHLNQSLKSQAIVSIPVPGAVEILQELSGRTRLGIATANFREAARLRLQTAGLWQPVADHAFGADGGGHKSQILRRAIAAVNLPPSAVVYIGDNLNDLEAGQQNGVHFIGFSTDAGRRESLRRAGASHVTSSHFENLSLISQMLGLVHER